MSLNFDKPDQKGWANSTIGDVAETVSTGPFGSLLHKSDYIEDGVPVINPVNLVDGRIRPSASVTVSEKTAKRLSAYRVRSGDILVARRGDIGRCSLVTGSSEDWLCGTGCFFIRLSCNVEPQFLSLLLGSPEYRERLEAAATGTTMLNLSNRALSELRVRIPSVEEQKRIVAVLDQAFAAIDRARAHAEANLSDAQRLFGLEVDRMRRSPAPSWPVLKLEKLAAVISGQHILAGEYNSERRGIGYLTGPSDFGDKKPIVSKWTEYPKRTAIRGDILITVKGSGVGSLNMMVEDELAISRQLMAIRTKPNLREFIYLTLEASYQHFQGLANGAAIPGISRSDVLGFELAMPTSAELPSLLNRLRNLRVKSDRLAQGYRDRLTDLANLRQSLLQKAFSGELT